MLCWASGCLGQSGENGYSGRCLEYDDYDYGGGDDYIYGGVDDYIYGGGDDYSYDDVPVMIRQPLIH